MGSRQIQWDTAWLVIIFDKLIFFFAHWIHTEKIIHGNRLANPDFQLFKNYKRFMKRRPEAKFYLLDPRSIWNLWKVLKIYTGIKIRQNPPSSGFIGLLHSHFNRNINLEWKHWRLWKKRMSMSFDFPQIFSGLALLLPYCSYVDIVEYMPSTRLTSRCHYYDSEVNIWRTKIPYAFVILC